MRLAVREFCSKGYFVQSVRKHKARTKVPYGRVHVKGPGSSYNSHQAFGISELCT